MTAKKSLVGLSMLFALTALVGCGNQKTKVHFWTGFGASVNGTLEPLIADFEAANPTIDVVYETKGGYPNLLSSIKQSISNSAFPHIANGYPDHFAEYANSNVLLNLNHQNYMLNEEHGVDVNDFYADYMTENTTISDNATVGLPFNKSTEIMVVNRTFFNVANKLDATIAIPQTWQELAIVGPKLKAVAVTGGWFGNLVDFDGVAVPKPESDAEVAALVEAKTIAFDMTQVLADDFIPFSWDSTSNFFITAIRQWGAEYTQRGATLHNGVAKFATGVDREKTLEALTYFKDLYDKKLVATPQNFNESLYSSNPFKQVKLVLTISSSAGVGENLPDGATDFPFELGVEPILYNAANPDSKFVISQGTNLALFRRGKATDENTKVERDAAWKLLRYLTYEVNHEFGKGTSYFPVTDGSKIAVNEEDPRYQDYKLYTDFLAETTGTNREKAIRETANLQKNVYQDSAENWTKFVDPGFLGSARIREEIQYVLTVLFYQDGATPESALNFVLSKLGEFIPQS